MAKVAVLTTTSLKRALRHLRGVCPVMRSLIKEHGTWPIVQDEFEPFETLVRSIISQLLSVKAADTIGARVEAAVPDFSPAGFIAVPAETLRACGLSNAKARYIKELASRVVDGRLDFDAMHALPNDEVVAALTDVPGIGRWTAEMFLIFGLKRPDVLALGDVGLQRSVRLLFGEEATLAETGTIWEPYRSVASWYLWKHLG